MQFKVGDRVKNNLTLEKCCLGDRKFIGLAGTIREASDGCYHVSWDGLGATLGSWAEKELELEVKPNPEYDEWDQAQDDPEVADV